VNRPLLIHLLFIVLGYALAIFVALLAFCIVIGLGSTMPDQREWGSLNLDVKDLPIMFAVGFFITAIYGLPGWLASVVFAEIRSERRALPFAIGGVFTAILAVFLARMGLLVFSDTILQRSILFGGFCGGLAYWVAVGKRSGSWRRPQT
jgi:hypothetical protein